MKNRSLNKIFQNSSLKLIAKTQMINQDFYLTKLRTLFGSAHSKLPNRNKRQTLRTICKIIRINCKTIKFRQMRNINKCKYNPKWFKPQF